MAAGYGYTNRGYPDEYWRRPIIPQTSPNNNTYSGGYNNVTEYGYSSPPSIIPEPAVRDYGVATNQQKWRDPQRNFPQTGEEFAAKVRVEAVQPIRPSFPTSATNWRSNPSTYNPGASTGYDYEFGGGYNTNWNRQPQLQPSTGYVNRSNPSNYPGASTGYDYESSEGYNWNRQQQLLPSTGYVNRNDEISRDNNYRSGRNDGRTSYGQSPSPLSEPTNDIGTAMEMLKDSAAASTLAPKRGTSNYVGTINTSDAARRYGNFNLSSRPLRTRGQF